MEYQVTEDLFSFLRSWKHILKVRAHRCWSFVMVRREDPGLRPCWSFHNLRCLNLPTQQFMSSLCLKKVTRSYHRLYLAILTESLVSKKDIFFLEILTYE